MDRSLSGKLAFLLPVFPLAAGLIACDPPIGDIETIRNDLSVGTSTVVGVEIVSIELRFRGEQDEDVEPTPDEGFESISSGISAPSIGGACVDDADCGGSPSVCRDGSCLTPVDSGVDGFECGVYDVRIMGQVTDPTTGMVTTGMCEVIVNPTGEDSSGNSCTTAADCAGSGFRCRGGSCEYDYPGEGFYICFTSERWDLTTHVDGSSCPALLGM